jgi:hypothetical protein
MNETNQEDWLDRQLREATPYIDDDGFTKRVVRKLPAPRQPRLSSRAIILIGLTVLGSLIAYIISDGGRFVTHELIRLATLPMWWLLLAALASGALVTVIGFAAALSKSRELQS